VGPRDGLEVVAKRKIPASAGNRKKLFSILHYISLVFIALSNEYRPVRGKVHCFWPAITVPQI